jgi:aspartate 1-decarboxylase
MLCMLKSKIRDISITTVDLEYEGSVSVDSSLLDKAGILPYEQVDVVNLTNGSRLTTYALAAEAGSGVVQLNGAAARSGMPGDRIMIICYAYIDAAHAVNHTPVIVRGTGYR